MACGEARALGDGEAQALGLSLALCAGLGEVVCVEVELREGVSEVEKLGGAVGEAQALPLALALAGSVGRESGVAAEECVAQGKALLVKLLPLPLRVPEGAAEAVPPPWPSAPAPPEALELPVTLCVGDCEAGAVSEPVAETLVPTDELSESDAVEHWLTVGEAVGEWLSVGEREEQPVCEGEGVGAALDDTEAVCEVTQRSVAGLQVACSLQFTDAE